MSKDSRDDIPVGQNLFTGVGSGRPTPRTKAGGMFGYVPDAFTSKSLEFSENSPKEGSEADSSTGAVVLDDADQENATEKENGDVVDAKSKAEERKGPMVVHEAVSRIK